MIFLNVLSRCSIHRPVSGLFLFSRPFRDGLWESFSGFEILLLRMLYTKPVSGFKSHNTHVFLGKETSLVMAEGDSTPFEKWPCYHARIECILKDAGSIAARERKAFLFMCGVSKVNYTVHVKLWGFHLFIYLNIISPRGNGTTKFSTWIKRGVTIQCHEFTLLRKRILMYC